MNAIKTRFVVSSIAAAVSALAFAYPASAQERWTPGHRDQGAVVTRPAAPATTGFRHADFTAPRRFVETPAFHRRPPVFVDRHVVVNRPVFVRRPVFVSQPAPVYYPARRAVYVSAPAPVYYNQPAAYGNYYGNPAGAVAGAVIGGVIGNQIGDRETRGITTVLGAFFGGLIGSGF